MDEFRRASEKFLGHDFHSESGRSYVIAISISVCHESFRRSDTAERYEFDFSSEINSGNHVFQDLSSPADS